jgi:hypothetical protein
MDFRPLNDTERRQLISALRGNAENDRVILMDRHDTSFVGTAEDVTDEEVISAINGKDVFISVLKPIKNGQLFFQTLVIHNTGNGSAGDRHAGRAKHRLSCGVSRAPHGP